MLIELLIAAIKVIAVLVTVLSLAVVLLWFERKGSALIHDRIGANRAAITGLGARMGIPNLGFINTALADPIKMFTKEDIVPEGADHFLHTLAPFLALFPVLITFAVIPFGDTLKVGGHVDQSPGGRFERGPALHSGHDWNRRVRDRARRMGLEQSMGVARRDSRQRPDDLVRVCRSGWRSSRS